MMSTAQSAAIEAAAAAAVVAAAEALHDEVDDLFDELEKDPELDTIREARMAAIKKQMLEAEEMKRREHGTYTELVDEKDFLKATTTTKLIVVHFYHKEFRRCLIMDKHMKILANRHFNTKFAKVNAEICGFLVDRLKIKILPCLVSFKDGISIDRIVGFEDLGGTDNFTTEFLEKRLAMSGVITVPEKPTKNKKNKKSIYGSSTGAGDDDEDYEDDDE